jgi:Ca-activated chloride channel family protein
MPDARIFICYRRGDSSDRAHRLHDSLRTHFGGGDVFIDLDLPPGADVRRYITEKLNSCIVLLAVIGPDWLTMSDEHGARRLDGELDYVRLEIATALLSDTAIVPLLVKNARMPVRSELPPEIARLADLNALELSDDRHWWGDVALLVAAIERILEPYESRPSPSAQPTDPPGKRRIAAWLATAQRGRFPERARRSRRPRRGLRRMAIGGLAVAAAFALVLAVVFVGSDPSSHPDATTRQPPDIKVMFNYSQEEQKHALLWPLIKAFNRERHKVGDRVILVKTRRTPSGKAVSAITREELKPTAWSPAHTFWGSTLNYRARRSWARAGSPVLMRSAIVIAIWDEMAKALGYGYPRRHAVGFEQIFKLARTGWKSVGRPEFGPFRFTHTNPYSSTTGVAATVAEYAFAAGKQLGDLQIAHVTSRKARARVRVIERAVAHSGDATSYVVEQLAQHGRGYASAVLLGEDMLLRFNRTHHGERLVAIYPKQGTIFGEHPFFVLDAPWVTPEHKRAARELGRYLTAKITPQVAAQHNYRPADRHARLPVARWRELGVDLRLQTKRLEMPEPPVIAAVQRTWRKDRKPANILIVLDTSGSMAKGRRLPNAKRGIRAFLNEIPPQDRVGLMRFSSAPRTVVSLRRFSTDSRTNLIEAIRGLRADGATATYDAAARAVERVTTGGSGNDIKAVVLLTDGNDTRSRLKYQDLLSGLRQQGKAPDHVRLYTVAYGPDARSASKKLARLAQTTGGNAYVGTENNIADIYREISSFF